MTFNVASLPETQARAGGIQINGATFAIATFPITQNASNCQFTASREQFPMPLSGGQASLTVTAAPAGCAWTAVSNAPWISITSGANGSLDGTVQFSVAPNSGNPARSGTLTVAGRTITVSQPNGTSCIASFEPASASYSAAGTSQGTVTVNACSPWTAASPVPWIRILTGQSGSGPGVVTFALDPNSGQTLRSATLSIAGQSFPITQAGSLCEYSLSQQTLAAPAAGSTNLSLQIGAPATCSWSVTESLDFVTVTAGSSGIGNGSITLTVAPNPNTSPRSGEVNIAGRTVTINQAASNAFACSASAPQVAPIRREGAAELVGAVLLTCGGTASQAINADIVVKLNTVLTSKLLNLSGETEAVLLAGDANTLVPGVNIFTGRLLGADSVRFSSVPLAVLGANPSRTFRVLNLRADATVPALGNTITATVRIESSLNPIGVTNSGPLPVAASVASTNGTFGAPTGTTDVAATVTFRELIANAWRIRLEAGQDPSQPSAAYPLPSSESGFVNSSLLGPKTGFADTATRLLVRLRNVPIGVRVFAATQPTNASGAARLVSADRFGNGVGYLTGTEQEIPVTGSEATITWEIVSTNPASAETLDFSLVFRNATQAQVASLLGTAIATLGPLPTNGTFQPVPRFTLPGADRPSFTFLVKGRFLESAPDTNRSLSMRSPTGNRSLELQATNASSQPADVQITGNASSNLRLRDCIPATICDASANSAVATFRSVDPGETVTAVLAAELRADAADSRVEVNVCASEDFSTACDVQTRCLEGFSVTEVQAPTGASSGTLQIYACGSWTLSNNAPWLSFSPPSGTGNATVTYTVQANSGQSSRTVNVILPGGATLTVAQLGGSTPPPPPGALRFVPVPPCRLVETRPLYAGATWTGAYGPPRFAAAQTRTLPIAGGARCNIPATAKAFMLNVTADTVEENTGPVEILTIYPTGTTRPLFGTIRTSTGGYIANAAIVQAGVNGSVDVYSSQNVHAVIDISGYFTDDAAAPGLLYYPFGPCRAVDTRSVYNTLPAPYGHSRLQARETRSLRLPGSPGCAGLPAAPAYSLQMTLAPGAETNGSPVAYLTAWPSNGQAQPIISNMNAYFGYAVANSGIVPASTNGSINLFAFDATNVILDVNGYFGPDDGTGRGLYYFPVTQCRAVNTQDATLTGTYGPPQFTPATDRVIAVAGSPRCSGLPATAKAWALNATAIPNGVGLPFLSMWPAQAPWPGVSQLNAFQGQMVSNSGIVPAGPNGAIQVKVNATTHAVIEVSGYFSR